MSQLVDDWFREVETCKFPDLISPAPLDDLRNLLLNEGLRLDEDASLALLNEIRMLREELAHLRSSRDIER